MPGLVGYIGAGKSEINSTLMSDMRNMFPQLFDEIAQKSKQTLLLVLVNSAVYQSYSAFEVVEIVREMQYVAKN